MSGIGPTCPKSLTVSSSLSSSSLLLFLFVLQPLLYHKNNDITFNDSSSSSSASSASASASASFSFFFDDISFVIVDVQ